MRLPSLSRCRVGRIIVDGVDSSIVQRMQTTGQPSPRALINGTTSPSVPRSRAVSSHPRNVTLTPGGRTELTHALKQPPKTPSPPGTPWRARGVVGGGVVSFRDRGHLAGRPRFALQNEGLGQVTGPGWDKQGCDLHTQRILDSHYRDGGSDAFSVIYRRPRMPQRHTRCLRHTV